MKKYIGVFILSLMLMGCITIKQAKTSHLKPPYFSTAIGSHPYQCAGYYETNDKKYVTRILINRAWIKEINKDKYYIEVLLNDPITSDMWH